MFEKDLNYRKVFDFIEEKLLLYFFVVINSGKGVFIKHIRAPSIKNNSNKTACNLVVSYFFVIIE